MKDAITAKRHSLLGVDGTMTTAIRLFDELGHQRLERVERLCSSVPKIRRASRLFDEQAYREATRAAGGPIPPGAGET